MASFLSINSQNILLNGDFEVINPSTGNPKFYLDQFYMDNWMAPSECSVDIFRDVNACDEFHIHNIEPGMDFCLEVASGDYCMGLYSINHDGYMEHITGELSMPLLKNEVYIISFYIKNYSDKPFVSKGFGYKFSQTPVVFDSEIYTGSKLSPFYQNLFSKTKVFADFEFDEYIINSEWKKINTYYTATGSEKFITFGNFAFKNDAKIMKQFKQLSDNYTFDKMNKFIKSEKSLVVNKIDTLEISRNNGLSTNYYLVDNIKIERVLDEKTKNKEYKCENCLDLDTSTRGIPQKLEFFVDQGFVGDLSFAFLARLNTNEKMVIVLNKGYKLIVANTGLSTVLDYSEFLCSFQQAS
jgi:hypothetical protein